MSSKSMDIGGGGGDGTSFQFNTVGATVTGRVADLEEVQQTDMDSGKPAFWDDGKPKMMYAVTLKTDLRNSAGLGEVVPNDDGTRTVYLKGSKKAESASSLAAVLGAVRAVTGGTALAVGGTLTLAYVGDGEAPRKGYNAPKRYSASYVAPTADLSGAPAPVPTPAVAAAPAPAAAPAATASTTVPSTAAAGRTAAAPATPADPLAGLTDAQRATLGLPPLTPAAPAWDADPRVAGLRAMGVADDAIRAALQI